jgi:hypothetical protein
MVQAQAVTSYQEGTSRYLDTFLTMPLDMLRDSAVLQQRCPRHVGTRFRRFRLRDDEG